MRRLSALQQLSSRCRPTAMLVVLLNVYRWGSILSAAVAARPGGRLLQPSADARFVTPHA
jgi:hypothetical protein